MANFTDPLLVTGLKQLMGSGLIDAALACPYASPDEIYIEELVDSHARLSPALRPEAFPFFDAEYYVAHLNSPLRDTLSPLEHFLRFGFERGFAPHPLIQPGAMLRARPDLLTPEMDFSKFAMALSSDWCDPSPFLWLAWYRARAGLNEGACALLHYLKHGAAENLPPNPYFEPKVYAAAAPDAPRNGVALVRDFLERGDLQLLPAGDRFDPVWYVADNPDVRDDDVGPLWHFLSVGRHLGRSPRSRGAFPKGLRRASSATSDVVIEESPALILERHADLAKQLVDQRRARIEAFRETPIAPVKIADPVAALKALAFEISPETEIDILIPCHDEFEITVECLASLHRLKGRRAVRILLVDDASADERFALMKEVPGLTVMRNAECLHFLRSCNHAFTVTSAPYLLLLNNDTQALDGAIDRLVEAIESDPGIGAAAPMFLYPNGRLQEAGCTLRHDGESTMTGVGDDPALPAYNYRRDIEYGSAAGLMLRRAALNGRLFDALFAPAYCEDADLCLRLREAGWRIVYEPSAKIIHHLSVSTAKASRKRRVQMVRANQQKLAEKWGERLARDNRARVLAFYLPQFHPIPAMTSGGAKALRNGPTWPRPALVRGPLPAALARRPGFYDLRRAETLASSRRLARRYGVEGFCVYYYCFGGRRLLDSRWRDCWRRPDIGLPVRLCWANENWTRHWDGAASRVLLEQQYDDATLDSVAADLVRFAADPRSIRVDGKPLVMIYRPTADPHTAAVAARFRRRFAEAGTPAIHLVYVESMEALDRRARPADLGFDACVEFPPQGVAEPYKRCVTATKAGWDGHLYDYAGTVAAACLRPGADYVCYPGVIPSWDNTARQPLKGTTLVGASPELFQATLSRSSKTC